MAEASSSAAPARSAVAESSFGLQGGFPGDDAKLARARSLAEALLRTSCSFDKAMTAQIIAVLTDLPRKGRWSYVVTV